jgi:hypothetical protein
VTAPTQILSQTILFQLQRISQQNITTIEKYTYISLPQACYFRLLHLEPGSENDELRCHLEDCSFIEPKFMDVMRQDSGLDDHTLISFLGTVQLDPLPVPKYEALSYVWGNRPQTCTIVCLGKSLAITPTLDLALRKFRYTEAARALWVDQICINQEDIKERGFQVHLMALIFSNAQQVLMWLGPDPQNLARDAIELMGMIVPIWSDAVTSQIRTFLSDEQLHARGLPARSDPRWKALGNFFDNPYFTRIWIVQEVRVAQKWTMLWGNSIIDFDGLLKSVAWLVRNRGKQPTGDYPGITTQYVDIRQY